MKMWNKNSFLFKKEAWERKLKNKKGGEKWLSVWWFFVLAIIGVAIVIGVLIYYNADVNIKEIESDILVEKIFRCLIQNGYLRQDFLQDNFDIFKECRLKKELFAEGSNFYFKITLHDSSGNDLRTEIKEGDLAFGKECEVELTTKAKHFPKCAYKDERALYYDNTALKEAKLTAVAGSNQEIKKVQVV